MDIAQQAAQMAGIKQTTFGSNTYSVKLLPATNGLATGQRLIKAFGPALGVLLDSGKDKENLYPEEDKLFTDLAVAIVHQIDDLEFIQTVKELLNDLSCNSQPVDFDKHFSGRYGELIAVVEFALKENFGDFFSSYLKAKGLEIPTLRSMMATQKDESQKQSNAE